MKNALSKVIQWVFGLVLIFFGLNGFLQFMPSPEFNEVGSAFLGALFSTGYIFPLMSAVWIVIGILFLLNRWSAFGAVVIFPISLNLIFFHLFLDVTGILFGLIVFVLNIYLLWVYRNTYKPLFN